MGTTVSTHSTETNQNGMVMFAGLMMVVAGFFQSIFGLVALLKPSVLLATGSNLILLDYTQWGWVHLITGIVLLATATALFMGRTWGRIVAVILATMSAILNFSFIWAYPLWSIIIIALDVIVIFAVTVYGIRSEEQES